MHSSRAPARLKAGTKANKLSTKQNKKFTTKRAKKNSFQHDLSPFTQAKRNIMNVWDDKESKEEILTYAEHEGSEVIPATLHSQSFLYLNRPKQLNALNLKMVRDMTSFLRKWETNPQTLGVIVSGVGDKAFCAGGDIMTLYNNGKSWVDRGDEHGFRRNATFFREEYQLNWNISRMITPYVAFMNGITMGGGVGIGMHGQHRIATEKTLFAMPETGIGFFPDVGASHLLPRLPHNIGMYLALTGARLKGADLVHVGLASAFMFTSQYGDLYNSLTDDHHHLSNTNRIINSYAYETDQLPKLSLTPHIDCISRCFSKGSVEEIVEALKQETKDVEFAQKTIATLEKMSPLSLKVTHQQMTRGATMDLDECLSMEYDIATNMISNRDFYTGVHSVLLDKSARGKRPNWKHTSISHVKDSEIASFFDTPHGFTKLDVSEREPIKGNGWASIRRIKFDEENSKSAGPSAYQYPMFRPLPQQLNPVEWTTTHEFSASKDIFHLMYWNYLFKHTHTRFPLTQDPASVQTKMLSAHGQQLEADKYDDWAENITGFDQLLEEHHLDTYMDSNRTTDMGTELADLPKTLFYRRQALMHAKKYIDITPHPEERKKYQEIIDEYSPKEADSQAIFGLLNDKMDELGMKYPMASFVLHKMRNVTNPLPLLVENFQLPNSNEGRETFFAEEIMFKYPTDQVVAIKQQLKQYYTDVCSLLKVPLESAPAMMAAEFGSKNVDILGVFGPEWKENLMKPNPKSGSHFGDLFSTFLSSIESMSRDDARVHANQLGINLEPAAVFPNDTTKQGIYSMMMKTIDARHYAKENDRFKNTFQIDSLNRTVSLIDQDKPLFNDDFHNPNIHLPSLTPHRYLPLKPNYTAPNEDDINVKGVFSEGEIDEAEDTKFVSNRRRQKLEITFQNAVMQLETLGAVLEPIEGGVLVLNLPVGASELVNDDYLKGALQVNVVDWDKSGVTDPTKRAPFVLGISKEHLDEAHKKDAIEAELRMLTPNAPIASGGNYQGETELMAQLTLQRKKQFLSDEQVKELQTTTAIFIPSTAVNLEANASILQRLLDSRVPLPFDRQINENKMLKFADTLAEHFDPKVYSNPARMTPFLLGRHNERLVNQAIRDLYNDIHTTPVRFIDNGEILDGEVIPASLQKLMKPYEIRTQALPTPQMFHASASLQKLTHSFHDFVSPEDQGEALGSVKIFSHLSEGQPELQNKQVEYTTARTLFIKQLTESGNDITRPPGAQNDPDYVADITAPHPVFHDFFTQADAKSVFMPVSKEERLARSFLNFIRVPGYAVDAVYPAFNYFLDDPQRNPGKNFQLNFEDANPYGSHPDAFKINYGDISRPMLPPKFARVLQTQADAMRQHENIKGLQKV